MVRLTRVTRFSAVATDRACSRCVAAKQIAFDPSRFLSEARTRIPRSTYLSFGVGPRTCIGSSFALQEATIVLAILTRDFDMRLRPDFDVWPLQRITLRPAEGLPMEVRQRLAP